MVKGGSQDLWKDLMSLGASARVRRQVESAGYFAAPPPLPPPAPPPPGDSYGGLPQGWSAYL